MNDTELMMRVKEGDEEAFRQIVEKYQKQIMNLCFQYTGNQQDAEELAQDVFIRIYRAAASYEPRAKLSTYLYRIAVNLSLNRIRNRRSKRLVPFDFLRKGNNYNPISQESHNPDHAMEQKEKQQIIWDAIHALPANQQTALILKRFQGFSYKEIAKVMHCSVSSVESLLHRAKKNLQKKLGHLKP
ncbi:sigma-70 family RNA polymerase sigma factor [bacterium]|nr:sigma-70 family RNA polymerase sigma factor [bacterium]